MFSVWIVLIVTALTTVSNVSTQAVMCVPSSRSSPLPEGAVERVTSNLDSLPGHGPTEVNLTRAGWCSVELTSVQDPYIQFEFTDVYIVYTATVRGVNTTNVTSYVTSLQVSADPLGTGVYHLVVDPSTNVPKTEPTNLANGSEGSVLFNGGIGFGAKSLRILPQTWSGNPPCMKIEFTGCLADTDTITVPESSSPADDSRVLLITLPIALVTILIVALIAIVSVLACYCFSHKNKGLMEISKHKMEMEDDRTIKHIKNELYVVSSNRRFDQSSGSVGHRVSQSPQPYEVARTSNADQTLTTTLPSSMGSDGYAKVKDGRGREVKGYEIVNFEPQNRQNQLQGYEVVGDPSSTERGGAVGHTKAIRAYATVTMEEAKAAEKKAQETVAYSTVQTPQDTSYLNVPPKTPTQLDQEQLGITESYGPEHFEV